MDQFHYRITQSVKFRGFTLSELLIALGILGVIATFTIPKVLSAQSQAKFKAIGKESIAMLSGAFSAYLVDNGNIPTTLTVIDLTPYLNYVKIDTVTPIDDWQTGGQWGCNNTQRCLLLHSGARVQLSTASFNGSNNTNFLYVQIDPDGQYSGITNGPGKALYVAFYYNGLVRTKGTMLPGSANSSGVATAANPIYDPPWFSW
ncbi:MAG: prepilin-type N-terminal cleavage/methylation domain-containing protein [Vampirovibrionales bacterium]|nr:prepilin-type N-terminal cleavage/methylation domain-containing protein [Vampirovibrionales bacterium]